MGSKKEAKGWGRGRGGEGSAMAIFLWHLTKCYDMVSGGRAVTGGLILAEAGAEQCRDGKSFEGEHH